MKESTKDDEIYISPEQHRTWFKMFLFNIAQGRRAKKAPTTIELHRNKEPC